MDHRAGLDVCGKSRPHRDSISGPSNSQQVAPLSYRNPQTDKFNTTIFVVQKPTTKDILYYFFWAISRRLNFMCRNVGT